MKQKHIFLLLMLGLAACRRDRLDVDVSKIPVEIRISRFDQDLFARRQELPGAAAELRRRYNGFYDLFCKYLIKIGDPADSSTATQLKGFATDPEITKVYQETEAKYRDLNDIEAGLTGAFRHYKYYFPQKPVPRVASFISGFNYAVVTGESALGIGLDKYLGKDYKIYPAMGIPLYKVRNMSREYIVADCMKGWAQSDYEEPDLKNFLAQCIYAGKILYFADAMLPAMHDTLKIGYSGAQLEWCHNNEASVWAYFIDRQLLFSPKPQEFMRFITEGPTTNGLPKESPAMLGKWIGWQIVRQYMEKNPGVSLEQLMQETNYQKILKESNYKPKK